VEEGDRYQNHQYRLQYLSERYDNIFILAVYDCCRNRKDKPKDAAGVITRGGADQNVSDEVKSDKGQMFSIFSCAAGSRTPADSHLSVYLLQEGKD
jgi:hypothetical protein